MKLVNIIMAFCYCFIFGVAASTIGDFSETTYLYFYIAAIIIGCIGLSLIVLTMIFEIFRLPKWVILVVMGITGVALGMGRFVHNTIIPPFVDDPNYPNHLSHFTDQDRFASTIVVGRISMEPELRFSPREKADITLKPEIIIPDPESDDQKEYRVGEGFINIALSADAGPIYEELARGEAYGYRVQFQGALSAYEPTPVPNTLDLKKFWADQNVFAKMNFYKLKSENEIIILKDGKTGEPYHGNPVFELAISIKDKMLATIKKTTPWPYSAFLAGVCLGLRRGLEPAYCIFEKDNKMPSKYDLITEEFRWSGTSHVLAVSGLHVSIITIMLYAIFTVFKVPKKISAPMIVFALIIFTLITSARPSSIRATIMNSLVVLAEAYLGMGLKTSLLFGIGVAAFSQLFLNPKLLFEPAFSLSYMAVLSLGLLTGPADRILQKPIGKRILGAIIGFYIGMMVGSFLPGPSCMVLTFTGAIAGWIFAFGIIRSVPRWLMQFISAQFAIQLGMMLPLSAMYFNHLPVAGPIANIVAIPLIGIIVQLGMLAGIIDMILPKIGLYIALMMNATNYLCIWVFLGVAHLCTVILPYPYMKGFTPKYVAIYYMVMMLWIIIDKIYPDLELWYYKKLSQGARYMKPRMWALAAAAAMILFILPAIFWKEPYQKYHDKLQVNFLNIGYGSAIHIRTPKGKNFMVNGGRFGRYDRGAPFDIADFRIVPYLLQQRIGFLDGVFITSLNDEDISGLVSVIENVSADKVYTFGDGSSVKLKLDPDEYARQLFTTFGDDYLADKSDKDYIRNRAIYYRDIMNVIEKNYYRFEWFDHLAMSPTRFIQEMFMVKKKKPVLIPLKSPGRIIYEEEYNGKQLKLFAVNPDWEEPSSRLDDMSMVLKLEYGKTGFVFFNGLKKTGENRVLRFRSNLKANVMQVPAHGTKDACSDALIESVSPEYAVLEFGYPFHFSKNLKTEAVDDADYTELKLQGAGATVLRTDHNGTITIVSDGDKILDPIYFLGTSSEDGGSVPSEAVSGY